MRVGVVFHILGNLLIFLGISMVLPLACALFFGENLLPLFAASAITVSSGLLLRFSTAPATELTNREGFAIATFGWISAALFGSLPFIFAGVTPNLIDAFFESMSGFSTTGATLLTDLEAVPQGILFWRSFTHWLGGMGIIVLSVAIVPRLGAGGLQLYKAEVPGPTTDRLLPRIAATARVLYLIYIGLSLAQTFLLFVGGLSLFEALTHTFATMGTGGFSTKNLSVAAFNNLYLEVIIICFMFLAGTNFSLHYQAFMGKPRSFWENSEFRFYIFVVASATLLITLNLWWFYYDDILISLRHAAFQVVSIVTTTGFISADYESWPVFSQSILLLLMFLGGCAGSTGGAIKQVRILVLLKYGWRELYRLLHPRAVIPLRLGNKAVPDSVVAEIVGFIFLYGVIFVISVLLLTAFNIDLVSSISAVAATLGNIGPGLGVVGPVDNYGGLPHVVKFVLSFLMLCGRLEIYTVLALLIPDYLR
jgi:trk system potassium uptake protein TrkH